MEERIMCKIFQYIMMAVAVVAIVSCSNEQDEPMQPAHNGTLQFVVSDFPAFGEDPETRAIGTQDEGKTAWEAGDEIIVGLYSSKYKSQYATLIYDGSKWNLNGSLSYLENETPAVRAYYAPCYEATGNTMNLRTGMLDRMTEYFETFECQVENSTISISFEDVTRDYSRLRIVGLAGETYTVTTTGFTPAGTTSEATEAYTLTVDSLGNAYLYGTFAEGATVTVKQGDAALAEYTFSAENGFPNGTVVGWSYALNTGAFIDGSSTDTAALVEKLKEYIDSGTTTITVTGSELAAGDYDKTAIGEAIYRLSVDDTYEYDETNPYNGTIDLILPDVTEIADMDFEYAYALKSITLPKVTKLGICAFNDCRHLQKITFESLVTEGSPAPDDFLNVGTEVGGCDLVLNCKQTDSDNAGGTMYLADTDTKTWWETEWKSITLTHSGENVNCDVCNGY